MMTKFSIHTEYINLQQLLKALNIAESGGVAQMMIEDGEVYVNGVQEFRKRKKLYAGDEVKVFDEMIEITKE